MEYLDQFCYLMLHWEYAKGFLFGILIFPLLPLFASSFVDFAILVIKLVVGFFEDLKK